VFLPPTPGKPLIASVGGKKSAGSSNEETISVTLCQQAVNTNPEFQILRHLKSVPVAAQRGTWRPAFMVVLAMPLLLCIATFVFVQSGNTELRMPADLDFSAADAAQVERGRYLAVAGNCASCHTAENGAFMAGGVPFRTPFGEIYSTNITPDSDTGIGNWTGEQFFRSMRQGVRPDGEHLYPVFPYTAFTKVSDEDIVALYAYLQSVPAVRQATPQNELSFPFNQRSLLAVWKALYLDAGAFHEDDAKSAEWNRGAYLVEALAHCSACHSPRNVLGAEMPAMAMSGGIYMDKVPGGGLQNWSAPNLTQSAGGLGSWPHHELAAYLKTGVNRFVDSIGPMNEVIMNSTRHLAAEDINAMAVYLKSLPANDPTAPPTPDQSVMGMGRTVYNLHCGTCHLPTGLGDKESAPQLARGSLIVQASDPASMINIILYSPELPEPPLQTKRRESMDEFQYLLTDDEIAAVATYVRNSWGNRAGQVSAEQVAEQR
jgi:mono/diheme cytochrome c family protein